MTKAALYCAAPFSQTHCLSCVSYLAVGSSVEGCSLFWFVCSACAVIYFMSQGILNWKVILDWLHIKRNWNDYFHVWLTMYDRSWVGLVKRTRGQVRRRLADFPPAVTAPPFPSCPGVLTCVACAHWMGCFHFIWYFAYASIVCLLNLVMTCVTYHQAVLPDEKVCSFRLLWNPWEFPGF